LLFVLAIDERSCELGCYKLNNLSNELYLESMFIFVCIPNGGSSGDGNFQHKNLLTGLCSEKSSGFTNWNAAKSLQYKPACGILAV
jgi:hypothetical protein